MLNLIHKRKTNYYHKRVLFAHQFGKNKIFDNTVGKNAGKQVPSYIVAGSVTLRNLHGGDYDWICQSCKCKDHLIQQFHSRSLFYPYTYICIKLFIDNIIH